MKNSAFPTDCVSFFAALREGIVLTTPEAHDPTIVWVSPSFMRMTGFTAADVVGRAIGVLAGGAPDARVVTRMKGDLAAAGSALGELGSCRKDGTRFLSRWRIDPLTDTSGRRTHWMVVQHQIADDEPREARREHLGLALAADSVATVVLDTHLRTIAANADAEALLGDFAGGTPFLDTCLSPPSQAQREELRLALLTQRAHSLEFSLDRHDGVARVVQLRCSPLRWPGTPARALISIEDTTDRRRIEQIAGGVSLSDNIGHAFAGIRHELGNPVNSLKSAVTLLRGELTALRMEQIASYLEAMEKECSRMDFLLRSLRNFSSLDSVESKRISVPQLVESFERVEAGNARKRALRFVVEVSPDCDVVWADDRALFQVLLNLTTNAFDACDGRRDPVVTLRVTRDRAGVRFDVCDNGVGIALADRDKLLRPFFTTKRGGTGLGLAMSQRLVTRMSGVLSFQSELGAGATFSVLLPPSRPSSGELRLQLLKGLGA